MKNKKTKVSKCPKTNWIKEIKRWIKYGDRSCVECRAKGLIDY